MLRELVAEKGVSTESDEKSGPILELGVFVSVRMDMPHHTFSIVEGSGKGGGWRGRMKKVNRYAN